MRCTARVGADEIRLRSALIILSRSQCARTPRTQSHIRSFAYHGATPCDPRCVVKRRLTWSDTSDLTRTHKRICAKSNVRAATLPNAVEGALPPVMICVDRLNVSPAAGVLATSAKRHALSRQSAQSYMRVAELSTSTLDCRACALPFLQAQAECDARLPAHRSGQPCARCRMLPDATGGALPPAERYPDCLADGQPRELSRGHRSYLRFYNRLAQLLASS